MIKVAYGSVPKDSGTFTFYRNQRSALRNLGYDLICVTVGCFEAALVEQKFVDDGCVLLAATEKNLKCQAEVFVSWCIKNDIALVMGVNSKAIISSIPFLPSHIKVVSRTANAFPEGYLYSTHALTRISKIIALVPRLMNELMTDYNVPEELIRVIPNGVDIDKYSVKRDFNVNRHVIKILFVGRLEHNQKGVLHIPKILVELEKLKIPYHITIIGKGKHEKKLRKCLTFLSADKYSFLGSIDADEVCKQLYKHDVFLFTSHFEGCPNALLEAMVSGCVPISSYLEGITDFIVENGQTGFLHDIVDYLGFARSIERLYKNPRLLLQMSQEVERESRARFSNEICAKEYASIFNEVVQGKSNLVPPLLWDNFEPVNTKLPLFNRILNKLFFF